MSKDISIIIPVLNETEIINQCLVHLAEIIKPARCEIIVVDGSPAGNTIQSIAGNRIKKIISLPGRGIQMNAGARCATGRILLFLHADTLLPVKSIQHILWAVDHPGVAAGAFDLGINSDRPIFRITEKYVFLRSRITKIPYGDQAIFLREKVFKALGGFAEIPIMEDIDLMQRLKRAGYKIKFISEHVRTSPRRYEKEGIFFGTIRNILLSALFYLGVRPATLKRFYK